MASTPVHKMLKIDEINLDKDNPRIRRWIEMYGEDPTPEQIHLALGAGGDSTNSSGGTTYYSLRESIRTNGGIIHPIIVNKGPNNALTVIEGNTRVAIFRDFHDNSEKGKWHTIPSAQPENPKFTEQGSLQAGRKG